MESETKIYIDKKIEQLRKELFALLRKNGEHENRR